ncbi:CMRF35-like molecule 9, partial [Eschrichtius robustus]|nr:CMRF35-like molecule 9 [Eschrichtius robustus]
YGSLVGPKEISGFEGGTVSLQCTYGEELKKYRKYWCRESGFLISRCSGTVYSGEYGQEGRVSVHDNPRQLRFEVILRNLTLKDMGQYWCGVKRVGFDKTFSVSLLVFPGISRQATQLDSTSTEDTSFVPSRSSSKPRVSIPMTRMLAPVLVLLALLLATGLAALGSYVLQWRKKVNPCPVSVASASCTRTDYRGKCRPEHLNLSRMCVTAPHLPAGSLEVLSSFQGLASNSSSATF